MSTTENKPSGEIKKQLRYNLYQRPTPINVPTTEEVRTQLGWKLCPDTSR